ncbi:MAG: murein L,D-transpeptidase catalytic domain-containing protein, partial [Flavobacterium sp.]
MICFTCNIETQTAFIRCIFSFKPLHYSDSRKHNFNSTDPKLIAANAKANFEAKSKSFYTVIDANGFTLPTFESFLAAFEGYEQLKQKGKIENEILTIVDFSLSSTQERMWVIDMKTQKVI